MVLDVVGVCIVQLHVLHVSHVVHDLELLHQVVAHSVFNLVTACQVPPDGTLQDHNVALDHEVKVTVNLHPEVALNHRGGQRKVMNFAANNQASQALLHFLRRHVQSEVFLLRDSIFYQLHRGWRLVPRAEATESSLDFPGRLPVNSLSGLLK